MKIWSVDADDAISSDLPEESVGLHSAGVHETKAIQEFLAPEGTSRFLLVATKGCGKTLLLMEKRLRMERLRDGRQLLPQNRLLDRPSSKVKVFSKAEAKTVSEDLNYWENVWLIVISLSIIKAWRAASSESGGVLNASDFHSGLRVLFEATRLVMASDLLPHVLDFNPNEHFKARNDYQRVLAPTFRAIHKPMALFIDNIDEYFDTHLSQPHNMGGVDKRIWYVAQGGLASAVRDLHLQNHHIKVFASLRSEAFSYLRQHAMAGQQLDGSAVQISYSDEDLRTIFSNNLRGEQDDDCARPFAQEPFERFFGPSALSIVHPRVRERESIWSYVLRHTLMRPRDLMTIGAALHDLRPHERDTARIRRAVNDAATKIAETYLTMIQPMVGGDVKFQQVFSLTSRNVLSAADVRQIAQAYGDRTGADGRVAWTLLHKAGLLGRVAQTAESSSEIQRFERPGGALLPDKTTLPEADYYVMHPALNTLVRAVTTSFAVDTLNIVGDGRDWRAPHLGRGVIKGDVKGYSKIMQNPDLKPLWPSEFARLLRNCADGLENVSPGEGDSFVLIDANPLNLIAAVRRFARALKESPFRADIRAAADYGVFADVGLPLRTAARLESLSVASVLAMTGEFREACLRLRRDFTCEEIGRLTGFKGRPREQMLWDLRKNDEEEELLRQVFYVPLDAGAAQD